MDRGTWWATVLEVAKESDSMWRLKQQQLIQYHIQETGNNPLTLVLHAFICVCVCVWYVCALVFFSMRFNHMCHLFNSHT